MTVARYSTAAATGLAACALTLSIAAPAHAAEGNLVFEVVDWSKIKTVEHVITDVEPRTCRDLPEEVRTEAKNREFYRFTNNTDSAVILIRNTCEEFESSGRAQRLKYISAGDSIRELHPETKALLVLEGPTEEPAEEPIEEAGEEPIEEAGEEPAEEPIEEAGEEPVEETELMEDM